MDTIVVVRLVYKEPNRPSQEELASVLRANGCLPSVMSYEEVAEHLAPFPLTPPDESAR
jgi:hypothetical protein